MRNRDREHNGPIVLGAPDPSRRPASCVGLHRSSERGNLNVRAGISKTDENTGRGARRKNKTRLDFFFPGERKENHSIERDPGDQVEDGRELPCTGIKTQRGTSV